MTGLMRAVLPERDGLVSAELYHDPPELAPLPEEEELIARAVAKRRNEFVTARHCARLAMGRLGVPESPILKGDKGEPRWPDGLVGSLTHCVGFRGAGVGRRTAVRSFCAKEATYKAWFPLTQRWLGFEDAHITFDVDSAGTTGTFVSRILIDPAARSGPPLTELAGRWSVSQGLALTAIVL